MVYRFKLVSDEATNFAREIEIDSDSTFLHLRNAILDSVDYSKKMNLIPSFYVMKTGSARRRSRLRIWEAVRTAIYGLWKTPLSANW